MRMSSTTVELPSAEFMACRFCMAGTSGVRIRMPQKMKLYRTPATLMHSTIHTGMKTTSQLHDTKPSSFRGRKTNCSALTARNISSSKLRSCLTAHTQAPTLATLPKISGIKTRTQRWLPN